MVVYNPQCVLYQFGFDQGAACETKTSCINAREVEPRYMGEGRGNDSSILLNILAQLGQGGS